MKWSRQGNLDPAALFGTTEKIQAEARTILDSCGHGSGHVFNLGHGISKDVEPERVKTLVDFVHEYSQQYHQTYIPR